MSSPIIVQKYGGTSVGNAERIQLVARRVARHWKAGNRIAVVVSAMSGETNRIVDLVKTINPKASARSYDMAVSAGEQVTIGLLSAALEGEGINARPLLAHQLGIVTDFNHKRARIKYIETQTIQDCWDENTIPVIAGFQGTTPNQDVTTLGRGGSDTSGVALAAALKADLCEINTDVDGVYTADPRIVSDARLVREMDYESSLELAALGSKVLHFRCVEIGAKYGIPIVVRRTWDPDDGESTRIMNFTDEQLLESPSVTGVTLDHNVARVTVSGFKRPSFILPDLFGALADAAVNVDIIVHQRRPDASFQAVGFTCHPDDVGNAIEAIHSLKSQEPYSDLVTRQELELAKVSVVGLGMRSHSGVAGRVFHVLSESGIDTLMISTSEIKISIVVESSKAEEATRALHRAFFTKED